MTEKSTPVNCGDNDRSASGNPRSMEHSLKDHKDELAQHAKKTCWPGFVATAENNARKMA